MVSIAGALTRIKNQPLEIDGILDARAVENVFAEQGHQWRDRTLGPAQTVELFIRQVMDGNESCAQVRQHAGGAFSAGAYCAARGRLPVTAMWDLCRRVGQQLRDDHQDALPLWHGHRAVMLKASARQKVAVDRISFADALSWMRCTEVGETLWRLIVNPERSGRIEPRAVKRRPKEYPRLTQPRQKMREALKNQWKAG